MGRDKSNQRPLMSAALSGPSPGYAQLVGGRRLEQRRVVDEADGGGHSCRSWRESPARGVPPGPSYAPGMLRILRFSSLLRCAMSVLGLVLMAPSGGLRWPMEVGLCESAILAALVCVPRLRRRLGRVFLPLAIGWLLVVPLLEAPLFMISSGAAPLAGQISALSRFDPPEVWIAVLLMTWQYGRKGLSRTMWVLGGAPTVTGFALFSGSPEALRAYLVSAALRVGLIGILGYVVTLLLEEEQRQREQLEGAMRRLSQRAATVEQLAESRERNRLAFELHDTLAHTLTGMSVQLQALSMLLSRDVPAARDQLKVLQAATRSGIQEVRRSILALRASPLEELGLSEALRQFCLQQAERTGMHIDCAIGEGGRDLSSLDPLSEQAVYRVAVAALANAEQHSGASKIAVSLRAHVDGTIQLDVDDNGFGFDPGSVSPDRLGLTGMQERAAGIGARLEIRSAPGQGTHIGLICQRALVLPLAA